MRSLLLAVLVLAAAGAAARADEWQKRFAVTGTPDVRVETGDGDVILRTGASDAVEARVTTVGWKIGPDEVQIVDHQTANHVDLEIRIPRHNWNFGHRSIRVELTVPSQSNADVHTGDGSITCTGLKGDTRLGTGDGSINADSLEGTLNAHSGDGRIQVRGRFEAVELRTGDGSIDLSVSPGSKMAGLWRVHSGDGGVTVRLPEGFAADLDAHSGDGSIHVNLPASTAGFHSSENNFRGKLNGGGQTLRVETGDGSIRLERL